MNWSSYDGLIAAGANTAPAPRKNSPRFRASELEKTPYDWEQNVRDVPYSEQESHEEYETKIKEYTEPRNQLFWNIEDMVKGLNRKLQGLNNYYFISPISARWGSRIDWYVIERLTLFWNKKRNQRKKHVRFSPCLNKSSSFFLKLRFR